MSSIFWMETLKETNVYSTIILGKENSCDSSTYTFNIIANDLNEALLKAHEWAKSNLTDYQITKIEYIKQRRELV